MSLSDIIAIPIVLFMLGSYLWLLITDPKGFFLFFLGVPFALIGIYFLLVAPVAVAFWVQSFWQTLCGGMP
jgi:hypothetical protein